MNWIQNDNQNVDESINTPKLDSHYYLFIGRHFYSITLHSFDAVVCLMIVLDYTWKHLLFLSSSLVFFGNSVQKMCTSAPYHITMKARILGTQV